MTGPRPVAMVTGATRPGRVGLATACALARAGCDVIITHRGPADARERAARQAVLDAGRAHGVSARLVSLDLDDLSGVEALGASLAGELGRLDVLVHNASTYHPTPLADCTAEAMLAFFRVHAAGPALLTRALAQRLSQSPLPQGGAIVAMLDIHALGPAGGGGGAPRRDHLAYAMSKAALAQLVASLARDLAPRVRVNGVAPGVVGFATQGPDADPQMQARYLARVPLARAGTPDEAARVVCWLALEAGYLTGQVIRVDGGRSIT